MESYEVAWTEAACADLKEIDDYISLDFGNGRRLTTSWSGQKASGAVPTHVFKAWCAMVDEKKPEGLFLDRVKKFSTDIDKLWPEWSTPAKTFNIGQAVQFDFGPKRGGVDTGTVTEKLRTNYVIRFVRRGLIAMPGDLLARCN